MLGVVYFVLGYLLFAVLSIGVGAISSNATEGNSLAMFYTMVTYIPLWFLGLQMAFPNHPAWAVLTIFPVTAPIQAMLRLGISEIPLWQIITSIAVLAISIVDVWEKTKFRRNIPKSKESMIQNHLLVLDVKPLMIAPGGSCAPTEIRTPVLASRGAPLVFYHASMGILGSSLPVSV